MKLCGAFPLTERAASAYRLDTSESASDIEPVFFFRENAFPNEVSWKHITPVHILPYLHDGDSVASTALRPNR